MSNTKQHFKLYKKGKKWLVAGITTTVFVVGVGQVESVQADTKTSDAGAAAESTTSPATDSSTSAVALKSVTSSETVSTENSSEPESTVAASAAADSQASSDAESATSSAATSESSVTSSTASQPASAAEPAASVTSEAPSTATSATSSATNAAAVTSNAGPAATSAATTKQVATPTKLAAPAVKRVKAASTELNIDQWMPNKTLQKIILNALNRGNFGQTWAQASDIKPTDLQLLTDLSFQAYSTYIDGQQSFSLAGLQYATQLTKLDLLNNINASHHVRGDITDITPLASLTKLTSLQLSAQRVSDVTPLSKLSQLVDLNLSDNSIADFSSLNAAQYTKYFYYAMQTVIQPVVYVPVTGKYTMASPVKAPQGVTFQLGPATGKIIVDVPINEANPTIRLFYNGATNEMVGDKINFQVTQNQHMPGPINSPQPGFTVTQNPYTYYLIANYLDANGNWIADVFTPYIIADYAEPVTVNYLDEQNQSLAASETLTGLIGDSYAATAKTIPGYKLVAVPANQTGQFTSSAQTVNFIYEKAYATVTVHYQDTAGQTIQADTTTTGQVGTNYALEAPHILGYTYQATQGNATGTYDEAGTEVTFIYAAAYSTVTVHYQDTAGHSLQADTTITGQVGSDYTLEAPQILGYTHQSTQGAATGTYGDTDTTVIFIYAEAHSTVTVHYVDVSGKTLQADTVISGQIGTNYAIDYPELLGYTYQTTQGNATGTYTEAPVDVTFIYQAAYGSVLVHYQTTTGEQLQADAVSTGQIGTDYALTAPEFLGYRHQTTQGDITGTYGEQVQEVTFIYAVVNGTVTVQYQDADGRTLQANTVHTGQVGTAYTLTAPKLVGYQLPTTSTVQGTYADTPATITFVYPVAKSMVTIHYLDVTDQTLLEDTILTGQVGSAYQVDIPTIPGYTYQPESRAQLNGVYGEEPIEINLRYRAESVTPPVVDPDPEPEPDQTTLVTVHYVTAAGDELAPTTQFSGKVGTTYTTTAATIAGYQLLGLPTNAQGTLGTTPVTVTYYYEPVPVTGGSDNGDGDAINPGPAPTTPEPPTDVDPAPEKPATKVPAADGPATTQAAAAKIMPTATRVGSQAATSKLSVATSASSAKQLPQTDEVAPTPWLGLTLLASLLGLFGIKRRRPHDN